MPYGSKLHIPSTNYHLLVLSPSCSTRATYKKEKEKKKKKKKPNCLTFKTKNVRKCSGGKFRRKDHQQKNYETKRARELGRKTREKIGKGNHMTALRFQKDTRYPRPPFADYNSRSSNITTSDKRLFFSFSF